MRILKAQYLALLAASVFTLSLVPLSVNAQLGHQDLMNVSFALSYQMGKVYQMQSDCGLNSNIAPERAAGFFVNYMTQEQVQKVMDQYVKGMKTVEGRPCNKPELGRTLKSLMESTSNYINLGKEHTRPY